MDCVHFEKWREERLKERRIEIAFEALAIAYESKYVFQYIRAPAVGSYEWADMPYMPGDDPSKRRACGAYYAIFKRIDTHRDFFHRVWHIQPKCMAVFGSQMEVTFNKLHQARRNIEVAAEALIEEITNPITPGDTESQEVGK